MSRAGRVSAGVTDRLPSDVGELVRQLASSPLFRLLDLARGYLAAADKVEAVNLLLVDYGQELLSPFGTYQGPPLGEERVDQARPGSPTGPSPSGSVASSSAGECVRRSL
jgi:hypothetical protein